MLCDIFHCNIYLRPGMFATAPCYKLPRLLPANNFILNNDIFLVLLYAARIPPHLLLSVHGKIFTLSVKGATVDGKLQALLQLIRKKNIETVFIQLVPPPVFSIKHLQDEIRACTLSYPRAEMGVATCLTPIKDFCHSVYQTKAKNIHIVFDLLNDLQKKNALRNFYQLNMEKYLHNNSFAMNVYSVNDVYEAIRQNALY